MLQKPLNLNRFHIAYKKVYFQSLKPQCKKVQMRKSCSEVFTQLQLHCKNVNKKTKNSTLPEE
ncbi:hypothetical protein M5D96_006842 [Drosophila gunungcola]|uniref:Uncharacterized protein n=1 Tax=Drosophila gunungcola TaxID=103775 RepID=A0A9P9YPS3_9MUSC|nr:hypothetical protein M5D96_006842 [Drosophila gunungcola]